MTEQLSLCEDNPEYDAFVEKFKSKKTTDDCFTPPEVYDAVKSWVCKEYGIAETSIVRPFWPGWDYESFRYPDGCVVLDNPPFSILSKICEFYIKKKISFFLFAPSLTAFSARNTIMKMNHIICDCSIVYENGAVVRTSFVTSLGDGIIAQTSPELTKIVNETVDKLKKKMTKQLPKYNYPLNIVTAAMMQRYSKYGVDFRIPVCECEFISALDAQREMGKAIFGGGLLVSEKIAAERAAAERAAAERAAAERAAAERAAAEKASAYTWKLSEKELDRIKNLAHDDTQ